MSTAVAPPPPPVVTPTSAPRMDAQSVITSGLIAQPRHKPQFRAPGWLQVLVILSVLGSAAFVFAEGRILWGVLLSIGGLAFGASFLLRRMVGDDYGRA